MCPLVSKSETKDLRGIPVGTDIHKMIKKIIKTGCLYGSLLHGFFSIII